jgi:myo-inositol 2-dehydrogenase / D-chiro-inositol 1-dehydrogenase
MINHASRRQFIGGSAAGLGAMAFPAVIKAQGATQEFRVGLIGCGGRGSGAANQTLSVTGPNIKLVAMGDVFADRVTSAHEQLKNQHGARVEVPESNRFVGFDAYEKILAMPDVNVVILATPPGFRPFQIEAAVKAGKHIFTEKPVCVDSFGAQLCMSAAKEADAKGLKIVAGLQRRYQTSYLESYKRFQDGLIGDIVSARVYWNDTRPWVRDRMPDDTEMSYQLRNWYHFNWLSGDNIVEQHIHNIDIANWFLGDKHPTKARGVGGRQVLTEAKYGEIFDHHCVEFFYDDLVVHSYCEHVPNTWATVSEVIVGTKGVLYAGSHAKDHKGQTIWRHRGDSDPNPYQYEHDMLYKHIIENTPKNDLHYVTNSSMTAILGRYATYSGKEISWDEAINSNLRLSPDTFGMDVKPKCLPDANGAYPVAKPGAYDWKTNTNS